MAAIATAIATVGALLVAPVDVEHYRVRLRPDIAAQTVHGEETILLRLKGSGRAIVLNAGTLQIDALRWRNRLLETRRDGSTLTVVLPREQRAGTRLNLQLRYRGTPQYGLELHPQRRQAYTIFSTSQWMVANDSPADRSTLALDVALAADLDAIGTGKPLRPLRGKDGAVTHRWRLAQPMPSYLYGFAAGRFHRVTQRRNGIVLDYLGEGFGDTQLRTIFAETSDMLAFFSDKAGVPYAHRRYAQALVSETVGQELAGMALLSEDYGREVLNDASQVGLIAHEVSHQWWGNGVTCKAWTHFWLNEGIVTFMAAAWMQHRFGEDAYRARVDAWRARIDKLRADGKDKPLVFPDWNKPSADDRAVVYQKGAYAMHRLREELGEVAFWRGLRAYTRRHWGSSVETADLQRAMEQAAGRDLSGFFADWAGITTTSARVPAS